ncbi:unnamed protein product [Sphacelaria rigidula]
MENTTVTMCMYSPNMKANIVEVEAPGQRYMQVESFTYLGGKVVIRISDAIPDINGCIGQAWTCFSKHSRAVYDHPYVALATKVRLLRAEVIEVMLFG